MFARLSNTGPSAATLLGVVEAIRHSLELSTLGATYMAVIPRVVHADAYGLYVGDPTARAPRRVAMRGAVDRFVRRYEAEGFAFEWVARGLTTAEIGRRLHLSPNTVKYHLRRLFSALGANSRAEPVAKALAARDGSDEPQH